MWNFIVPAVIVAAGIVTYFICQAKAKNGKDKKKKLVVTDAMLEGVGSETLDSSLSMQSIVSYFRLLNLKKDENTVFMARDDNGTFPLPSKDGYILIFLGVYDNKSEEITYSKIIYCKELDSTVQEVFGKDNLVVLT